MSNESKSQFLLYQTSDGQPRLEVRLENETVWLSQTQMAELLQTTKQNVSLHIRNIFKEGELPEGSVVKEYLTTAADGKNYKTSFYNLDVIISVGYEAWVEERGANAFTSEQREWLDRMAEHIAASLAIEPGDFEAGWFGQHGSLGKAHELFREQLQSLMRELNEKLAA